MAFDFPDPNVTPEFTAPNGFTYIYDQGQALWKLAKKEPAVPMRVAPKFKTIDHLNYHEDYYGKNTYKCYKGTSSIALKGITRFAARNPETNRIIVITDSAHISWSDDEGATWESNTTSSSSSPTAWNYFEESGSTITGYHETPASRWIWCGGKRWMSFNTSFARLAWTENDFENVYTCRFDNHDLASNTSNDAARFYDYCKETDELWWLFTDGTLCQIDPDIAGWMDAVKDTVGQYGFTTTLPSNMPGVLKRKRVYIKKDGYNNNYYGRSFDCLATSPHGTKVVWATGGVCYRTEDDFTNYNPSVVGGWAYNYSYESLFDNKVIPNAYYYRIFSCYYVKETDVWIACGVKDFYVSFDDAKTWQEVEVSSVASAYDVAQAPYISGDTSYYGYTNQATSVGYTKGMYLYQTFEMTAPQYYQSDDRPNGTTPYQNYEFEKVLYTSADLKNWTRSVLPTSKKTRFTCGPFTFLEDKEAFLAGYGHGENNKTKHLIYTDSYI